MKSSGLYSRARDFICSIRLPRAFRAKGPIGLLALIVLALVVIAYAPPKGGGIAVGNPILALDRAAYLAGEPVTIAGAGFGGNENVTLQVTHAGGGAEAGKGHEAWTILADADGAFSAIWAADAGDVSGTAFAVTATGGLSGATTPATFRRIAVIDSDKFDYLPDETAHFVAAGFKPGEAVTVRVSHVNRRAAGSGHDEIVLVSDASGQFTHDWHVEPGDSSGALFVVRATGADTGVKAIGIFMDATVTVIDDAGPDDEPGQKDLNQMTTNYDNAGFVEISWNWDDTAWQGANTGDGCSLFDTDGDGFANYSLCVTIDLAGAFDQSRLYSCDADSRSDRCGGPTQIGTFASDCTAGPGLANSDPFWNVAGHQQNNDCDANPGCNTKDTVAACDVDLADFGGGSAFLINVCSYPSQEPNSDPSDCVVTPNNGFLTITKIADPNDGTAFIFNLGAGQTAQGGANTWTINGSGSQSLISFAPGTTYDLSEVIPFPWDLTTVSCSINTNPATSTGTPTATGVDNFTIQSGLLTTCTFTDVKRCEQACDDSNPCTDDTCDPNTGDCVYTDNSDPCDDGDACTSGDTCTGGVCAGSTVFCDDLDVCTIDTCNPATGCVYTPNPGASCDDGDGCTLDDTCQPDGSCAPGTPKDCSADDSACGMGVCVSPSGTCATVVDSAKTGTVCRANQGECDVAENCDGTSIDCPADAKESATTICRAAGGICDVSESCDGTTNACPGDAYQPLTTPCRLSATECDVPESCTGTGPACPADNPGPAECNSLTDTEFCQLPNDQFRLLLIQDPCTTGGGSLSMNNYRLNASNPGQFYYNVFDAGVPGTPVVLDITIPYPFITHGATPIQTHDSYQTVQGCFVPSPNLNANYTITCDGPGVSPAGNDIIRLTDYPATVISEENVTHCQISGVIPATGTLYITAHLDYGLEKGPTGWQQGAANNALSTSACGVASGATEITAPQPYAFSYANGTSGSTDPTSKNVFKKNPGTGGLTLKNGNNKPVASVTAQLVSSAGKVVGSAITDQDGYFQIVYMHKGKPSDYKVRLPGYNLEQTIRLKNNGDRKSVV